MTWRLPFFEALRDARRILIAGAGGGFDVYAGLPLALSLMNDGRTVHLANLSIVNLYEVGAWLEPGIAAVTPDTVAYSDYFPERALARWLALHRLPATVFAFPAPVYGRCARRTGAWRNASTSTRSSWWTAAPTSSCAATRRPWAPRSRTRRASPPSTARPWPRNWSP